MKVLFLFFLCALLHAEGNLVSQIDFFDLGIQGEPSSLSRALASEQVRKMVSISLTSLPEHRAQIKLESPFGKRTIGTSLDLKLTPVAGGRAFRQVFSVLCLIPDGKTDEDLESGWNDAVSRSSTRTMVPKRIYPSGVLVSPGKNTKTNILRLTPAVPEKSGDFSRGYRLTLERGLAVRQYHARRKPSGRFLAAMPDGELVVTEKGDLVTVNFSMKERLETIRFETTVLLKPGERLPLARIVSHHCGKTTFFDGKYSKARGIYDIILERSMKK